jgi:hypothetical protein
MDVKKDPHKSKLYNTIGYVTKAAIRGLLCSECVLSTPQPTQATESQAKRIPMESLLSIPREADP